MKIIDASPPPSLSAESRRLWQRLSDEYEIRDSAGRLILETAMGALDRLREVQQILKTDGASTRDRFDQIRAHPLLCVERDCRSSLIQSLRALKLDMGAIEEDEP